MANFKQAVNDFRKAWAALADILTDSDEQTVDDAIWDFYPFVHDVAESVGDVNEFCDSLLENAGKIISTRQAEAFYTGGGIWLSAMYIDATHYYVMDADDMSIALYDHTGEDDDTDFPCQNLVWSMDYVTIPDDLKPIANELRLALVREGVL